jgi:Ni,Fe-hydrogenase III small subunit/Pyruvate/2-oxoacid:ferredoxin oxidoreductase delta subunit
MWNLLKTHFNQGYRTIAYPKGPANLPERFRGRPTVDAVKCVDGCKVCAEACPTGAITPGMPPKIGLGKCLFCNDCVAACPTKAIAYTTEHRLAARKREDLVISSAEMKLAEALDKKSRRLFGHSLKLRQVAAGDCSGCAVEANVLNIVTFDLGRFGIQFVASPRHADGLLITGPVTENMKLALQKTYEAVPSPKLVIAVGACAISGGPFAGSPEIHHGADSTVPVDLYVPGCPPHPLTLLDGMLRLLARVK